jgi:hypothetical protein
MISFLGVMRIGGGRVRGCSELQSYGPFEPSPYNDL